MVEHLGVRVSRDAGVDAEDSLCAIAWDGEVLTTRAKGKMRPSPAQTVPKNKGNSSQALTDIPFICNITLILSILLQRIG